MSGSAPISVCAVKSMGNHTDSRQMKKHLLDSSGAVNCLGAKQSEWSSGRTGRCEVLRRLEQSTGDVRLGDCLFLWIKCALLCFRNNRFLGGCHRRPRIERDLERRMLFAEAGSVDSGHCKGVPGGQGPEQRMDELPGRVQPSGMAGLRHRPGRKPRLAGYRSGCIPDPPKP